MFALREQLYFCVANDRAVFLDLSANRYFCLTRPLEDAFQTALAADYSPEHPTAECQQLVALGVLTDDPDGAKRPHRPRIPSANLSLETIPGATDLVAMVDALLCRRNARRVVASKSLYALVEQVRCWKGVEINAPCSFDRRLRSDISAFGKSRRLHVSQDQCLASSLALLQFLRKRNVFPDLVIGVKMSPFAAHAWVQSGSVVLADDIDKVRLYTPILVV